MSGNSLIPDAVSSTLTDLANVWQQVQFAKANVAIEKAKVSLAQLGQPTIPSDPQAKTVTVTAPGVQLSGPAVLGLAAVAAVALWAIVK